MKRGSDLQADVTLSFMEAVKGTTRDVTVSSYGECGTCNGKGSSDGEGPSTCSACGGSGERLMQQGFFTVAAPCGECGGEGTVIKNKCSPCRGSGRVRRRRTVQVTIPAGAWVCLFAVPLLRHVTWQEGAVAHHACGCAVVQASTRV